MVNSKIKQRLVKQDISRDVQTACASSKHL